jgi:hypothetical protein
LHNFIFIIQIYIPLCTTDKKCFSFLNFYWIFSLFILQRLSPLPGSCPPPQTSLSHVSSLCLHEGVPSSTHPLPAFPFPYTGASSLHRTKGLFSHWCLKRPSSAIYVSGAMDSSLVGASGPSSSGESGWLILLFFPWSCKLLQLLQAFI